MNTSSKPLISNFSSPPAKARTGNLHRALVLGLLAVALMVGVSGCAGRIENRGNEISQEQMDEIKAGGSSRDQIFSVLGSPSSKATFGDEIWYYIFEQTETIAFLEPDIMKRQVLAVRFDENGVVSEIGVLGMESANEVSPVDRKTPTAGNQLSFFEQMIANFGRFNTGEN